MAISADFVKRLLLFLGIVVVMVTLFMCLILPDMHRRPSPRTNCMNNLHNLAIAVCIYHTQYGSLPPPYIADANGRPIHSWRVLLLPYLDRPDLYEAYRFDEPWNGPNNSKLHDKFLDTFVCPADRGGKRSTETSYVAVVGPQTLWPGDHAVKFDDVADGLGNTLLLVEVADSGIHWLEPRDLDFEKMSKTINNKSGPGISSRHPGGAAVAFADGRVRFLTDTAPAAVIEALLTANGGEKVPDNF